jgi:hypothetical protein
MTENIGDTFIRFFYFVFSNSIENIRKALLVIDHLIRNGSEQVIRDCRDNIVQIQTLTDFQHIDENNKDVGLSGINADC